MADFTPSSTNKPRSVAKTAYYLTEKNGGFELRKLLMEEDVILSDEKISDPDAWDQIVVLLEQELSRQFA